MIKDRFKNAILHSGYYRYKVRFAISDMFNRLISGSIPRWSGLNTLGKSRVVSLTALVLFIGSFIIFNMKVFEYLTLIPEILPTSLETGTAKLTLVDRLYLSYFGLTFIGVASFMFNVLCPNLIKTYSNQNDYIIAERSIITKPRITVLVIDISKYYIKYSAQYGERSSLWRRVASDERIETVAYQTFEVIADKVSENFEEIDRGGTDESDFYGHRGYMNIDRWMQLVSSPPTALRAVALDFYNKSIESDIDIMTLSYMTTDCYKPIVRAYISLFYLLGFVLLFIPTIWTLIAIISNLIAK